MNFTLNKDMRFLCFVFFFYQVIALSFVPLGTPAKSVASLDSGMNTRV